MNCSIVSYNHMFIVSDHSEVPHIIKYIKPHQISSNLYTVSSSFGSFPKHFSAGWRLKIFPRSVWTLFTKSPKTI